MRKYYYQFDIEEYSNRIHHTIRTILENGGVKIAIYPFGQIGQLCKRILNDSYGMILSKDFCMKRQKR